MQRTFDIDEYVKKAKAALSKLEQSQQPGQQTGKGGKTEIVKAVGSEIKALIEKGYTTKQIAEAFKQDVFGILPKTITELIGSVSKQRKPVVKKTATPQQNDKQQTMNAPTENTAGGFNIKPDSEDL